jgi:large subunit ribosomal protein L17
MRHRSKNRRLSRNIAERKALLKSLAAHLITYQRITTSLAKAKEARRVTERLISWGKENTLHARRQAYRVLNDRDIVKVLFTQVAPLFKNRTGGYTRIVRTYPRRGDGAEMVLLELTEQPLRETKKAKGQRAEKKPARMPKEKKEAKQPPQREVPETKAAPPPAHEKKAKEPRKEEKRPPKKGFFKDLRQYFKRKSID